MKYLIIEHVQYASILNESEFSSVLCISTLEYLAFKNYIYDMHVGALYNGPSTAKYPLTPN